jgi:hypothetical protein
VPMQVKCRAAWMCAFCSTDRAGIDRTRCSLSAPRLQPLLRLGAQFCFCISPRRSSARHQH